MLNALLSFFIDKSALSNREKLHFLRKQKMDKPIYYHDGFTVRKISSDEFYKIFEVEYCPNLFFRDLAILKKVACKSNREIKGGAISEKEIWLGTYFEESIFTFPSTPVYIKYIDQIKGYGLFALKDLKKDTYIGEYTGEVRKYKRGKDNKNSYCFEYKIGDSSRPHLTIDAKYMGNFVRFINHSYLPNLSTFAAYSGCIIHIIMKTNKFVAKDCELTYDYGPKYWKKRETPL
jgi:uncharacterized protein